jgi:hypothetical protein
VTTRPGQPALLSPTPFQLKSAVLGLASELRRTRDACARSELGVLSRPEVGPSEQGRTQGAALLNGRQVQSTATEQIEGPRFDSLKDSSSHRPGKHLLRDHVTTAARH